MIENPKNPPSALKVSSNTSNTNILKHHGKQIIILALCLCIPFISIWYIASYVNKNIFYEQKRETLLSFAKILDSHLVDGGYDEILVNAGKLDAPRDEQIATLNEALREVTDEVALASYGLGVGYYSRRLDAILTYGPSSEHQATVGRSIGENHPGRRVMATGIAEVSLGTMVRGNIMNAMLPVERGGEVIGYIWANNLVSELEQTLLQMSNIILLLLVFSYIIMLAIIVMFVRRVINTEQKYKQELSDALEEARVATRAKSDFLATMSHEIRTPMNAILGITEIQLHNSLLEQRVREGLEKIYASGGMLLGIINDILDLSKIEAGKLELVVSKYETASLISDTAQLNMMRIGNKPIEFELNIDENLPMHLLGDELRVKQILNNILSNAFKYTSKGRVRMSVSSKVIGDCGDAVMLIVSISDTGQGMSKEQLDKLFDEYSRFNLEANRSTEGTGLGMSITRALIHMMDGEITIESEPDKGSVFTVFLPQGRVNSDILGKEMVDNLHNFRTSGKLQMKRMQIVYDPMPYGSVLVVDDVETNIFVAKGLLSPYMLKIDSVDSGYGAIEKIQNGSVYDIVFMDHMMPKMDGIEATKRLREMGYKQPIVALTANAVVGQADIFLKNGFDDFISKPIDIRQLNVVLNKLIRDKQSPEVIEEARRCAQNESLNVPQTADTPKFAEIFVRDANKSIAALDAFIKKGSPYNEEEIKTFIIHTHGIKSALANIKEMELSAIALKLEQLGRDNNIGEIAAEAPAFLDLLRDCVNKLKPQDEQVAGEGADEDAQYLTEKLLAIKAACQEYDESAVEVALKELRQKVWSQKTKNLLETISEKLLHSDFDEIANTISTFMEA